MVRRKWEGSEKDTLIEETIWGLGRNLVLRKFPDLDNKSGERKCLLNLFFF